MNSIEKVWSPIPGTSQELALDTRCQHTLYVGTRGPGKTDCQLMRFRRRVGQGYGAFWKGIILDREYKNLDDIVTKSKRWFSEFDDGAVFLSSAKDYKWVWPTGEELLFRAVSKDDHYWDYHGHEYPFIGWNELTKFPTRDLYDMFMSTNRVSFRPEDYPKTIDGDIYKETGQVIFVDPKEKNAITYYLPEIPLEVFSTTNPYGIGHGWVKRDFIDVAPYGKVVRTDISVIDPKTKQREVVTKTQVAIFGSYVENIYLSKEYIATLHQEKDPNRKKAWLTGSWDIVAGGAFDDVWNRNYHVVPRFVVPHSWKIERSFDWGSSHPFSVGWWALANGEEAFIVLGSDIFRFCPAPGSLIQIYELYGGEIGYNKGVKWSAGTIAQKINDIEETLMLNGWIKTKPNPGAADNQISDVRESDSETIAQKMEAKGVYWTRSDKSAGSRVNGMQLFRDRLEAAVAGQEPAIYFMENCKASIATIPILPRDDKNLDDVDTEAEDHAWDMVRYEVLSNKKAGVTNVKVNYPT